eukprot:m.106517 g.106517  ORF g.106517 m.106517 type:complete len:335 (-) comp13304_c1_seq1:2523-3527(-)
MIGYLFFPFTSCWLNAAVVYAWLLVGHYVWRKVRAPGIKCEDKHVFITGGSTGLGLATAIQFAQRGAKVTVVSRSRTNLDAAEERLKEACPNAQVRGRVCDVTKEETVATVIAEATKEFGPIEFLVCSAGLSTPGYFLEQSLADHKKQMDLNYFGCVNAVHAVAPAMKERKSGTIVLISSAAAFAGMVGYSLYVPSKFALRGFADCLRNELLKYNINVTAFYPSNMDTPGFEIEERTKPVETKTIEGSIETISADKASEYLMNGLAQGHYSITNDPLAELGRIATGGVAPREHMFLELIAAPIFLVIGLFFQQFMDWTVRKGPGRFVAADKKSE